MKLFRKYMFFTMILIFTGCSLTGKPEAPFDYSRYEFVSPVTGTPLSVKVDYDTDLPELAENNVIANISKRNQKVVDIVSANKASKFAVGYENGLVDLYDWADLKKYKTIDTQVKIKNFKINQTASHLAVLDNSFNLKIYNILDASVLKTLKGVYSFTFSDFQDYFAVGFYNSVSIYQYSQSNLIHVCDIQLTERSFKVQSIKFAPMKGLIGVHFAEEYDKKSSEVLHIYSFGKGKSKLVAHHKNDDIQDFTFFVTNNRTQRIILLGYEGRLANCRMSDFGDEKTLELEGISFEFKLSKDLGKYAYRLDKTDSHNLLINTFVSKQSTFPIKMQVDKNARFEFSPAGDAILVEFQNALKLINLEVNEFTIGNEKISWFPGKLHLANAVVKIAQADLQENGQNNTERESNEHNLQITLQNGSEGISQVVGEMIFKNRDETVKKITVYFGRLYPNKEFTRNVKFKYPEGMLKGEPSIDLKIHAGDKVLAEQTISVEPSVKPVPNLKLNWYFAEETGNGNGIIEPGDVGKLHLLINNSGRAAAIITSFKLNQVIQDVLKIEAGTTKNLDFTFGNINFEDKFKSLNVSIEYSNSQDIEAETIKLVKDVYLPVSSVPMSQNKITSKKLYVASKFAYLRSAPSKLSHPLAILNAGSELTVSQMKGDFYKVDKFINSAGAEMPVWVDKVHLDDKILSNTSGDFALEHVFDAPPLIILKETAINELNSYVPDFMVHTHIFTPEGLKNNDFTHLTDGHIVENHKFRRNEKIDDKIIEDEREFKVSLAQDRSTTSFMVTDMKNQKFEYKLNLNLREITGSMRVLAIGIREYEDLRIPELLTAENDVNSFSKTLQESNLTMSLKSLSTLAGKDATKKAIEQEIDALVRTSRKDDFVIIYFSGHSTREIETGKSYLLPYDAKAKSVYESAISLEYLKEKLVSISSEQKLLIVDNTSEFNITKPETSASFEILTSENISVMIASEETQRSGLYSIENISLFTSALTKGLEGTFDKDSGNDDGFITFSELAGFVKDYVKRVSEAKGKMLNPICNIAYNSILMPLVKIN